MFQIAIIVFREILEVSLVIGILAAATKDIKGRDKWIYGGLALGILGSIIVASFTSSISELFNGSGQEAFNAGVLLTCSAMISYTVIWMNRHAKSISSHLKYIGKTIVEGKRSLMTLVPIIAFSVLREGSEIALFSYGAFISGNSIRDLMIGGMFGLALGLIVGLALYQGMIRAFGKYFFSVTTWLLIFLAAGMVAQSMGYLSNGGFIPEIIPELWDSSHLIKSNSIVGKILNVLIGYIDKPSAIQFLGYLITLSVLFTGINFDKIFKR